MTDTSAKEVDKAWTDFDGNPIERGSLADRVMGPGAEGWRPNEGDVVTGIVTELDEGSSDFGSYPLVTIRTPEGNEVAVHCFHMVLQNRISNLIEKGKLIEGDEIAIRYVGQADQETAKKGQDAPHLYRVAVQRPEK